MKDWNQEEDEEEGNDEPVRPDHYVVVAGHDGFHKQMKVGMFLDKDGNEVQTREEASFILAHDPLSGWYELNLRQASWYLPTFH